MRLEVHSTNLLQEFNKRNERAFYIIFQEYHSVVYSHSYYFLGDRAEAQDVTQEVFVKLWRQTEQQFAEHRNLKAFLLHVARNTCFDTIRKQKRQNALYKDLFQVMETSDYSLVERVEMIAEFDEILHKYIEKLPQGARIIYKSSLEGLSNKEIAARLAISDSTVRSQIARATELLRALMVKNELAVIAVIAATILHLLHKNHGFCSFLLP